MPFKKEQFVTAHFIDDNREHVEILLLPEEVIKDDTPAGTMAYDPADVSTQDYESYIISYLEENRAADRELLDELIDLDTLHENTYQNKKNERLSFEMLVKQIGQEEGLIGGSDQSFADQSIWDTYWKWFFSDFNIEAQKEELFSCKLSLFELDYIKEKASAKLKGDMRKAKTPIELIKLLAQVGQKEPSGKGKK